MSLVTLAERLWNRAKIGSNISVGPVALHLRLARAVSVCANRPRGRSVFASSAAMPGCRSAGNAKVAVMPLTANDSAMASPVGSGVALIVGAGPDLGSALARRFSRAGMAVAVAARNAQKLDGLIDELGALGGSGRRYGCDATDERSVKSMLKCVLEEMGIPDLVVYNVQHFIPGSILEIETSAFEECWRAMALGGFIVGREVARLMVPRGSGTIIYTGATGAMRGREEYINMAVGKFGVRALSQSMARELGPKGIHVAHVILDGGILSHRAGDEARERNSAMRPEHIAETYFQLHLQHRSTWTQEMDLRTWVEKF
jgi:NAD(P)-dependent dehydrogenase (short-subunit alcohol dehydrogenase family)